jgi:prepilin-type N-terminal cleavage/methylation domain-containing protein
MNARLAHRRAYTLIEILVVVSIMGIAAAIVVPSMLHAGSLTIQAAARIVVTDLVEAQNEAVATKATRKVVFDSVNNSYRVTDPNGVTLKQPSSGGSFSVDFDQDKRFAGVRLEKADFSGATTVSFDELGTPSNGGYVELSADGHRYRVTVKAFTGRVTVAPVNGG